MTNIENFLSLVRRKGYEKVPVDFKLCPSLAKKFDEYVKSSGFEYKKTMVDIPDLVPKFAGREEFLNYYPHSFKDGTKIDMYGVAHEPGSAAAFHMTKMYHPMESFDSVEQVMEYPLPGGTGSFLIFFSFRACLAFLGTCRRQRSSLSCVSGRTASSVCLPPALWYRCLVQYAPFVSC